LFPFRFPENENPFLNVIPNIFKCIDKEKRELKIIDMQLYGKEYLQCKYYVTAVKIGVDID
jgi:hypothetical protein